MHHLSFLVGEPGWVRGLLAALCPARSDGSGGRSTGPAAPGDGGGGG